MPQEGTRPISSPAIEVQNTVSPIISCGTACALTSETIPTSRKISMLRWLVMCARGVFAVQRYLVTMMLRTPSSERNRAMEAPNGPEPMISTSVSMSLLTGVWVSAIPSLKMTISAPRCWRCTGSAAGASCGASLRCERRHGNPSRQRWRKSARTTTSSSALEQVPTQAQRRGPEAPPDGTLVPAAPSTRESCRVEISAASAIRAASSAGSAHRSSMARVMIARWSAAGASAASSALRCCISPSSSASGSVGMPCIAAPIRSATARVADDLPAASPGVRAKPSTRGCARGPSAPSSGATRPGVAPSCSADPRLRPRPWRTAGCPGRAAS